MAVRLNFRRLVTRPGERPRRRMATANAVRTSGYVALADLRTARYELLWGELGE